MSEGASKKKSAAAKDTQAAAGDKPAAKKKGRPPPLQTQPDPAMSFPGAPASLMNPGSFALPTMRNMFMSPPTQQIVVSPATQVWDLTEQTQLDRLHRVMCFPNESLLNKSIKISAHLNGKTARDVACRLKVMEETDTSQPRALDDIDRQLARGEAIIAELQAIPSRDRTEQQTARMNALLKEFTALAKDSRSKLDAKRLSIPIQMVHIPEVPMANEQRMGSSSSSSSNYLNANGK